MITCWAWTRSPTFSAQGCESRRTETCPVMVMTLAAASCDTGNNWAKQVGAAAMTSSAQTNPWMPLTPHKVNENTGRFHTKVLCRFITNPSLNNTVYHQKCLARRYPIGFYVKKLYRFNPFQGREQAERIQ